MYAIKARRPARRANAMHKRLRRYAAMAILTCSLAPAVLPLSGRAGGRQKVSVYFPNWNVYDSAYGQVKDLPWDAVDCVYHAFWKIAPSGGGYPIVSTDPYADTDPSNPKAHFPQYAKMSQKYPKVDIFLSIGGWTCSGHFSEMASTAAGRASFIESCLDTLEKYPFFDGLDIDWEYPGVARKGGGEDEGNPASEADFTNYTLLLSELRTALTSRFGKGAKRLTVCAGAAESVLKKQDYASLFPYVDQVQVMTYDMSSSSRTSHHSPLYGEGSADRAVKYLQSQGVPAAKISIGSPLYGHSWKMKGGEGALLGRQAAEIANGRLRWSQLEALEKSAVNENVPGWHAGYDEEAQAAYLWNDDPASKDYLTFHSYESSRSLDAKLNYIHVHSLGGIIVWESGGDSAAAGYPMLRQMYQSLHP